MARKTLQEYRDEVNPGELLRDFLKDLYPKNISSNPERKYTYIDEIDAVLMADDEFSDLTYESCINYLVRRLIITAKFYQNKYPTDKGFDEYRYKEELKRFLEDNTRFNATQRTKLVNLLSECLRASDAYFSNGQKTQLILEAKRQNYKCFSCGVELEYDNEKSYSYVTIDHIWPRDMGGLSHENNLKVMCRSCNSELKKNYIDASDFHYEVISLASISYNDYMINRERQYDFAVFSRQKFSCAVCDAEAQKNGSLKVGRKNKNDSWHFLNLEGYCAKHHREDN